MLDDAIPRLFGELFETRLRERRYDLQRSTQRVKERMSARGMLQSGMTVTELRELFVAELRARGALAWEQLQSVISLLGFAPTESAVEDLATVLAAAIDKQCGELSEQLGQETSPIGMGGKVDIADDLANLKRELYARVELLVRSLQRQRLSPEPGHVFNFHGMVGALQTGTNATTSISIELTPAAIEQLRNTLNQVQSAITRAPELAADTREELTSIATEVQEELARDRPSKIRVGQLAQGIGTAIQTAASLQPAYAALKHALWAIGVTLP